MNYQNLESKILEVANAYGLTDPEAGKDMVEAAATMLEAIAEELRDQKESKEVIDTGIGLVAALLIAYCGYQDSSLTRCLNASLKHVEEVMQNLSK